MRQFITITVPGDLNADGPVVDWFRFSRKRRMEDYREGGLLRSERLGDRQPERTRAGGEQSGGEQDEKAGLGSQGFGRVAMRLPSGFIEVLRPP
jgi:hypothetical protein